MRAVAFGLAGLMLACGVAFAEGEKKKQKQAVLRG